MVEQTIKYTKLYDTITESFKEYKMDLHNHQQHIETRPMKFAHVAHSVLSRERPAKNCCSPTRKKELWQGYFIRTKVMSAMENISISFQDPCNIIGIFFNSKCKHTNLNSGPCYFCWSKFGVPNSFAKFHFFKRMITPVINVIRWIRNWIRVICSNWNFCRAKITSSRQPIELRRTKKWIPASETYNRRIIFSLKFVKSVIFVDREAIEDSKMNHIISYALFSVILDFQYFGSKYTCLVARAT